MIVVDTNVIAHAVLNSDMNRAIQSVRAKDRDWIAPALWKSEMRNTLLKYIRIGLMSVEQASQLMHASRRLLLKRKPASEDFDIFALATRSGCTAYDCEFVALAITHNVPLLTFDKQVLKAFPSVALSPTDFQ